MVVSRDAINQRMKVIAADVTTNDRPRSIPTYVPVDPSEENGLTEPSFVICHELSTFVRGRLDASPEGRLSAADMARVDKALLIALDFAPLPPVEGYTASDA